MGPEAERMWGLELHSRLESWGSGLPGKAAERGGRTEVSKETVRSGLWLYSSGWLPWQINHKLSSFKQHRFIILQVWKSEVQNGFHWAEIEVWEGLYSLTKPWRECVFLPFLAARIPFLGSRLSLPSSKPQCSIFKSLCFHPHVAFS